MMTKERQKYEREFKQQAVELSFARGNAREIADELGIRAELLYRWRREYHKYENNSFPGKGKPKMTDLEKENARLHKELRAEPVITNGFAAVLRLAGRKTKSCWSRSCMSSKRAMRPMEAQDHKRASGKWLDRIQKPGSQDHEGS